MKHIRESKMFILGYELAKIEAALENQEAFGMAIHADNFERAMQACINAGRGYEISFIPQDASDAWRWLKVDAEK